MADTEREISDLPLVASVEATDVFPLTRAGASKGGAALQIASYVIALLTSGAPTALDTWLEIVARLEDDEDALASLLASVATKASLTGVETLTNKTLTAPVINSPSGEFLRGRINGLTLSNNAGDSVNDIDIAVGSVFSREAVPNLMTLAAALTKRLDANWAAGTGNGMRWSGEAIANKTYHLFAGTKADGSDTEVFAYPATAGVDADSDAFAATVRAAWQAETGGSGYVRVGRIGSIIRVSGSIVPFHQVGDFFHRTPVVDRSNTAAAASALLALSVPDGIVVAPLVRCQLNIEASEVVLMSLGSAGMGSANVVVLDVGTGAGDSADRSVASPPAVFFSNTSRQIYFAQTNDTGTPSLSTLTTYGWVDRRGRA